MAHGLRRSGKRSTTMEGTPATGLPWTHGTTVVRTRPWVDDPDGADAVRSRPGVRRVHRRPHRVRRRGGGGPRDRRGGRPGAVALRRQAGAAVDARAGD